jgi:hypothetical protein
MSEGIGSFFIIGYENSTFTLEKGKIQIENKPSNLKISSFINYSYFSPISTPSNNFIYTNSVPRVLSFDFFLDSSGAILGKKENISEKSTEINDLLYKFNEKIKSTNFLRVVWGDFDFKGKLKSLDIYHNMFDRSGKVSRANFSISILEIILE